MARMGAGVTTSIALRQRRIRLQAPGLPMPDGEGGWTEVWTDLVPPQLFGWVRPTTASDMERLGSNTVTAAATLVVTLPFHPGLTSQTRLLVENGARPVRTLAVLGYANPDSRDTELEVFCSEVLP